MLLLELLQLPPCPQSARQGAQEAYEDPEAKRENQHESGRTLRLVKQQIYVHRLRVLESKDHGYNGQQQ